MTKSIIRHFVIIGSGTFISMIISFLTTIIITRVVTPDDYGKLAIFTLYSNIALMIFCLGLDQSLVRFYYQSDNMEYKRKLLYNCWFIPVLVSIICGIVFFMLTYLKVISFEFTSIIVALLIIYNLIQILNRFSTIVIRLQYKSKMFSMLTILQKSVYIIFIVCISIFVKHDYFLWLTVAMVISLFIVTVIGVISEKEIWFFKRSSYKTLEDKNDLENIKLNSLAKYGFPFIISMGITTLFQALDKIILNYYFTYAEVGVYSSAMNLVNIFVLVQTTFTTLWAPMSVEHYENDQTEKSFYQKGNQIVTVIMFVIGITLILYKDIFSILLGPQYREAAYILPFLIFNPIMYTISETTVGGIVFMKKSKLHILIALGAFLTNLIGDLILVPNLGYKGAAISNGVSYIVFFILRTLISNRYFYIDFKLKRLAIITLMTILYALYNTFVSFNFLSIVGYVIVLILIFMLYREVISEGFKMLKDYKIKKYTDGVRPPGKVTNT